jgi:hypothetical protein
MDLVYTRALYPPGGEHLGKNPTNRKLNDRAGEVIPGRLHLGNITTDGGELPLAKVTC